MRARLIAAVLAAVLAVIGVVSLVSYAKSAQDRAWDNAKLVTAFQVVSTVPANAAADVVQKAVKQVQLPTSAVPAEQVRVTDLSQIRGLKTNAQLEPGEVLVQSRFTESGNLAADQAEVPEGLQQMSLQVAADAANGPLLKAGSKVGIILSSSTKQGADDVNASKMVASQVLVTKVSSAAGDDSGAAVTVTFAVDEKQAAALATAANFGKVRLTVQNDNTTEMVGTVVTLPQLMQ